MYYLFVDKVNWDKAIFTYNRSNNFTLAIPLQSNPREADQGIEQRFPTFFSSRTPKKEKENSHNPW